MDHKWSIHPLRSNWLQLDGVKDAVVRTEPIKGQYIWQFRKVVSFADTVEQAKEYVEAGAEFFETFKRNPYALN